MEVNGDGQGMKMLDQKVAVVTGVGPGMGRSIAIQLATAGAQVVMGARRERYLTALAEEVRSIGLDPLIVPLDLSSEDQCARIIDLACERFGGVDIFVQNGAHDGDWTDVASARIADWRHVLDVNFFGALAIAQRTVPSMIERGGGRIVLINSGAIYSNPPRLGAYAASKAALASLARTMAVELGPSGILVNSVTLGAVLGDNIARVVVPPGASEEERDRALAEYGSVLPLGRLPTPDECAGAVLFLASPLADAVTGQNLVVNGGQWLTA
jgi:NAD(P)-dependent dehydrogenase (short-subunit alcohol dehydrogenase family)